MNKRKTLRMTSILLALMMFFGMVSVLLVPAGVAGAAGSATVDITIDAKQTTDSNNIIVLDEETYTLKVSEVIWADSTINKEIDSVRMTLRNWNDDEVKGYRDVIMTASRTEDGIYTYPFDALAADYPVATKGATGLYTMELWRNFKDGTKDQVSVNVAAFWLLSKLTAATQYGTWTELTATSNTSTKAMVAADAKIYMASKGKIEYKAETNISVIPGEVRFINPVTQKGFVGKLNRNNLATTSTFNYDMPDNTAHGTELVFASMATDTTSLRAYYIEHSVAGSHATSQIKDLAGSTAASSTNVTDLHKAEIDIQGPTIEGLVLSGQNYIPKLYEGFLFQKAVSEVMPGANAASPYLGETRIEMKSIADKGVGMKTTLTAADMYAIWTNIISQSYTHKTTVPFATATAVATGWSGTYYNPTTNPNMYGYNIKLSTGSRDTILVDGQWNLGIVATDALGNESTTSYGRVNVLGNYIPVTNIRVESQNVLEMYKGQELTFQDLVNRNVSIYFEPQTASFTDVNSWIWQINAAASGVIEYDDETGMLIAIGEGEARLYAKSLPKYTTEAPYTSSDYLRIIVTKEPSVKSIRLNNSSLNIKEGDSQTLTATVDPVGATVTWETSNGAIATVDQNGKVTGVKAGTALIIAKAGAEVATCTVTVSDTTIVDPDPPAEDLKGWVDENNNRYYYVDNQKVVGWRKIDGSWYFFDYSTAAMRANGWLKEGGKWYYLNSNGTMKSAEWFKDNNGKWYWLKANGAMAAGWEKINGTWYYFNASGAMQTGWVNVRGIWYYMKSSGAMAEGWLQDGSSWYYLTPGGGAMVTGRVTINGRASNFATSGRWLGYV